MKLLQISTNSWGFHMEILWKPYENASGFHSFFIGIALVVYRWPPIQSSVSRSGWPPRWSTGVRSPTWADGLVWHHQNGARETRTASTMHRTRSSPPNTEGHSAVRMARAERTSPRPSPRILDIQGWDIRTQRGALQEPPCHHSSSQ